MFGWLARRKACTPERAAQIKAQVAVESAREDVMFDEYLALPEKPMVKVWLRDTEVSAPRLVEVIDIDQYRVWRAWRVQR